MRAAWDFLSGLFNAQPSRAFSPWRVESIAVESLPLYEAEAQLAYAERLEGRPILGWVANSVAPLPAVESESFQTVFDFSAVQSPGPNIVFQAEPSQPEPITETVFGHDGRKRRSDAARDAH